jgi:hypothetical protein
MGVEGPALVSCARVRQVGDDVVGDGTKEDATVSYLEVTPPHVRGMGCTFEVPDLSLWIRYSG